MHSNRWTQQQTDEHVARCLARLVSREADRKKLLCIEHVAWAWSPTLTGSCFGFTRWHVRPTPESVGVIVAEAAPDRPVRVRVAALAAIARAGEHASLGVEMVKTALGEGERALRLVAARAAADARLVDGVARELRNVLGDDVWSVRWHASRALVSCAYDSELGALARMLVMTTPKHGGMPLTSWAHAVNEVRPRCRIAGQATDLDAHVTHCLTTMSGRDRDFAWPLWR